MSKITQITLLLVSGLPSCASYSLDEADAEQGSSESAATDEVAACYKALGLNRGSLQVVFGTPGNDIIDRRGLTRAMIIARAGDDTIYTSHNGDLVCGDSGADLVTGGDGADRISGGFHADRIYGGKGDDRIEGNSGDDYINGNEGNDIVFGGAADMGNSPTGVIDQGNDELHGGKGDDYLDGGDQNDKLYGELGNDQLFGGCGNDLLDGGDGDEVGLAGRSAGLYGDFSPAQYTVVCSNPNGNDRLVGGPGIDRANGEGGRDTCVREANESGWSGCEVWE